MPPGRYVVLGLAQARSPWFRAVAQWANSAMAPIEFVKVVSAVEVRAHLRSGRPFSAVLVDGALPALDRDLVDEAAGVGCAVIVVDDVRVDRDWKALGAHAVVNPMFGRQDLLDVLAAHATLITRGEPVPGEVVEPPPAAGALVAAVCGPGGTGASTVTAALAQGLGDDVRHGGLVLLADLKLRSEQAMLHDARDVVPGVQELVEAHRAAQPSVDQVRSLAYAVDGRHYDLLLGLRHPHQWAAVRPRAFAAAFDSLCRAWRVVVCDLDADLETEQAGGSADVEDRTVMARTAVGRADVVLVVGQPGMKGLHAVGRVVGELLDHGVPAERITPVVNRAPKAARARAEQAKALAELTAGRVSHGAVAPPVYLPDRRVDDAFRDGARLPAALSTPLASAFTAVVAAAGRRSVPGDQPQPVRPGRVGSWS